MTEPATRSAVLLDAQPLWLAALVRVLERAGARALAQTSSPAEALAALAEHQPDLFILDPLLAGGEAAGLACLRAACAQLPTLRAVVISAAEEPDVIGEAFEAGASIYVLKRASAADLVTAVRQAFEVSIFLPPAAGAALPPAALTAVAGACLTRREREILALVAEGQTNARVAGALWVTEQTVKFHLSNIYRKLEVSNRTQASRFAQQNGLLAATAARP